MERLNLTKTKARKIYGKDTNEQRKMIKIVKLNKGRTTRVYAINTEGKRLLKQRREKALQNAKNVHLPPHSSGKAKHPRQIKISSKHTTAIAEPSICDPLPGSQATVKVNGDMPDPGDKGIYEFLIKGAPNPPDLEGIEEDQLLEIQQNIQDKLKQRDEERERNITKRMKQYKEKYDFINKPY